MPVALAAALATIPVLGLVVPLAWMAVSAPRDPQAEARTPSPGLRTSVALRRVTA